MRITVNLSNEAAELLNKYCPKRFRIRSAVISMAVENYFKGGSSNDLTEQIKQMIKYYKEEVNQDDR